jgi:hypothetical protein
VIAGPLGWGPVLFQVHGIGLDFVEPPYVPGDNSPLEESTVLALHPRIGPEDPSKIDMTVLDNVVIGADGARPMTYSRASWTVL